jgi:amino-acid N-acetyltransferase
MPTSIEPARLADVDDVIRLLAEQRLPPDGLAAHVGTMLVARHDGRIVGSAALEIYPDGALLRSVAVAAPLRRQGLGRRLIETAIGLAEARRVPAIYLLTTTAADYFPKLGFEGIARADVPATVQSSVEFTSACPATATVMRKRLKPRTPM